ncbi:hypothetical protein PIB30_097231 [Stylosanthes scabra]|uniref:Uncharacterized protein n=1 Tax=Stylosanthes scabra TaxID=79078 RepID=A0ABU6WZ93_9FABA|nr:hypothetical protein [Stylosanthes scabra]
MATVPIGRIPLPSPSPRPSNPPRPIPVMGWQWEAKAVGHAGSNGGIAEERGWMPWLTEVREGCNGGTTKDDVQLTRTQRLDDTVVPVLLPPACGREEKRIRW